MLLKIIKISLALIILIKLTGCEEDNPTSVIEDNGKIVLISNPEGASILLQGTDIGKITPDSITNMETGSYEITLKLYDYQDTTFMVDVYQNIKSTKSINLKEKSLFSITEVPILLQGTNTTLIDETYFCSSDFSDLISDNDTLKSITFSEATFYFTDNSTDDFVGDMQLTLSTQDETVLLVYSINNVSKNYADISNTKRIELEQAQINALNDYLSYFGNIACFKISVACYNLTGTFPLSIGINVKLKFKVMF